eukprot:g54781.t1
MLYANATHVEHDIITKVNIVDTNQTHATHAQLIQTSTAQHVQSGERHGSCMPFLSHAPSHVAHSIRKRAHAWHKHNIKALIILAHETLILSA